MYSYIYIHRHCTHISGVDHTSRKNQLVQSTCPACGWHHDSFWQTSLLGQNNMEQHLLSFSLYFLSLFYIILHILLHISIYRYILYDLIFYMSFDDKKQLHNFIIYYIHFPTLSYISYILCMILYYFYLLFYDKQLNHTISRPFSFSVLVDWVP